jgi:hypothetical protein
MSACPGFRRELSGGSPPLRLTGRFEPVEGLNCRSDRTKCAHAILCV